MVKATACFDGRTDLLEPGDPTLVPALGGVYVASLDPLFETSLLMPCRLGRIEKQII
jgi:hypothetical protein